MSSCISELRLSSLNRGEFYIFNRREECLSPFSLHKEHSHGTLQRMPSFRMKQEPKFLLYSTALRSNFRLVVFFHNSICDYFPVFFSCFDENSIVFITGCNHPCNVTIVDICFHGI